jgi:WD40 repeat protein
VRSAVVACGHLFASFPGGRTTVWRLETGAKVGEIDAEVLALDPRGRVVAALNIGGDVRICRADTLEEIARHEKLVPNLPRPALSPGGQRLAVASLQEGLRVFDALRGTLEGTLSRERGMFKALAFSPDGTRLATAGADGTVRLWDPETRELVLVLKGYDLMASALAWSADGRRLITAGGGWSQGATIHVWEAR